MLSMHFPPLPPCPNVGLIVMFGVIPAKKYFKSALRSGDPMTPAPHLDNQKAIIVGCKGLMHKTIFRVFRGTVTYLLGDPSNGLKPSAVPGFKIDVLLVANAKVF